MSRRLHPPRAPLTAFGPVLPANAVPTVRVVALEPDPRRLWAPWPRVTSALLALESPGFHRLELAVAADRLAALALEIDAASATGRRVAIEDLVRRAVLECPAAHRAAEHAAAIGAAVAPQLAHAAREIVAGRLRRRGLAVIGRRVHRTAAAGLGRGRMWPAWRQYRRPLSR